MEGGGELSRFIRKGRKKADKGRIGTGRIETHLHSPGFKGWVYVYGEFGNPLGEREREMVKFPRWRIHSYRRMQNEETEETFRIVSSYAEDGSCCACLDNEDRLISCKSLSLRSLRRERRKRRRGGKGELIRMGGKKKFGKKSSIPHSLPMEERYEQVNL